MQKDLIGIAALATRIVWVGNRLLLAVFAAGLLLSLLFHAQLAVQIAAKHPTLDPNAAIDGLRLLVLIGIGWALASDRLLGALLAMIASARIGDPFVATNARRLRVIGWALLAMQFLDFAVGRAAIPLEMHDIAANHTGLSISGWLSVLMAFVLAQIFMHGSDMRDDLKGTI